MGEMHVAVKYTKIHNKTHLGNDPSNRVVNIAVLQILQQVLQYSLVLQQVLQYWLHV